MIILIADIKGAGGVKGIVVIGDNRQSFALFQFEFLQPARRAGTVGSGDCREALGDNHLLPIRVSCRNQHAAEADNKNRMNP